MSWSVFASIALVHALGVLSPGPDLALVVRQSLVAGFRAALRSSWGIALGLSFHALCTLLAGAYLQSAAPGVLAALRIAGAVYLLYLGIRFLLAEPIDGEIQPSDPSRDFWRGVLVNLANAKVAVFFIAILSVMVPEQTAVAPRLGLAAYLCIATGVQFSLIGYALSHFRVPLERLVLIERITGAALIIVALNLGVEFWGSW
ncbi:MAG: LysE family translocator [Gammaproteobacteria bacterium AqS3]|nr:LysE family translocator [Gammaproteobacteria bacterium AqS3]